MARSVCTLNIYMRCYTLHFSIYFIFYLSSAIKFPNILIGNTKVGHIMLNLVHVNLQCRFTCGTESAPYIHTMCTETVLYQQPSNDVSTIFYGQNFLWHFKWNILSQGNKTLYNIFLCTETSFYPAVYSFMIYNSS